MTLIVELPPELELRLKDEAARRGVPTAELTIQLLREQLEPIQPASKLDALLDSWLAEDDDDQLETGEHLIRALDEDRLSDRPLFPVDQKGKSW